MSRAAVRVPRPSTAQVVQAKLAVSAVDDPLEIEADQVASQVVSAIQAGAAAPAMAARRSARLGRASEEEALQGKRISRVEDEETLQGKRISRAEDEELLQGKRISRVEDEELLQGKRISRVEEEETLQGKRISRVEDEEPLQGKRISRAKGVEINDDQGLEAEADVMGEKAHRQTNIVRAAAAPIGPQGGEVDGELEAAVNSASGGQSLPDSVRGPMEAGFGADFGAVKVHLNSPLAPALGALAFARGTDVHFAPGRFDPASVSGQHLIAHELTHVVQQGGAPATAGRATQARPCGVSMNGARAQVAATTASTKPVAAPKSAVEPAADTAGHLLAGHLLAGDAPAPGVVGQLAVARSAKVARAGDPKGEGMTPELRSGIETLSGMSMDAVKVHYNSPEPAKLNALAYAQGNDIHLAPGAEKQLAHEAWHVVQQKQGRVAATTQM